MIIEYLSAIYPMTDELKAYLSKVVEFQTFKKKEFLLREGQVSRYIYIIWKGMVRCYYTLPDGQQVSARFMVEGDPVAPIHSFFKQVNSYESLMAFEDCELYAISYEHLQYVRKTFLEFNFIAFELIMRNYLKAEERLLIIRRRTAKERYELLREQWPGLLDRVPKRLIASYIDLAPSAMSRKIP
jgi:CRP/FNR family transcriptional regulator, anaerobic regulatory protein